MNKIISINIKGFVFQVEEEAYDRMKNYLETLNRYFANEESRIEIIDDIESRLAEMMQEKLKTRPVITMADVEEIINIMGRPTDFDKEKETGEGGEKANYAGPDYDHATYEKGPKRFMRDTENSLLGGVCAGAGHYFGIDPLWIRLGFLFLFFVMGTGLLFYLILWVIIPSAKTPTDRLQMRGEKINIDNIEKAVKEEYERVKKNFNDIGSGRKPVDKAVGIAGDILKSALKFIAKVIAVFLIFVAATVLIALVSVAVHLVINGTLPLVSLAFDAPWQFWLTAVAALVLLAAIILGLIKASVFLFNPRRKPFNNRAYRYTVGTFSSLALITLIVMAIMVGTSFSARQTVSHTKTLDITGVDTLTVSAFNPVLNGFYEGRGDYYSFNYNPFRTKIRYLKASSNAIKNDSLWCASKLEIRESNKDYMELEVLRWSNGVDDYQAKMYAELIPVDYTLTNGRLVFNTHFYPGDNVPFRDQHLEYRLWVPKNKVLKIEGPVKELLHWKQKNKLFNRNYKGTLWAMSDSGMRCLDCQVVDPGSIAADARVTELEPFTDIDITIPAEIVIKTGDKHSVAISGPLELVGNLHPYTHGNTLSFDYDRDLFDIFSGPELSKVKIVITLSHLERLEASGAAVIELLNITGEKLDIDLNGACRLEGEVYTGRLNMGLSGAAKAELEGKVENFKGDLSGAAKLSAYELEVTSAKMDMSGASYAELAAATEITGDASGASKILYKGNPALRVDVSGASKIKAAE